jgi:hypothetical protein
MKSYTDLEQSRKLAEILPLESADAWWVALNWQETEYYVEVKQDGINQPKKAIPCWSLAALRNLLPVAIKVNENTYLFESHNTFDKCWIYRYYNEDDASCLYCKDTNEVDACVAIIEKLHEMKML